MNKAPRKPGKAAVASGRGDRLSEQLRANLQKRKAQARARRAGEPDRRPDGLDPAKPASDQ